MLVVLRWLQEEEHPCCPFARVPRPKGHASGYRDRHREGPSLLTFHQGGRSDSWVRMLFGQYLIHVDAISPEDVLAALDDQLDHVERFGRIAVKLGYLDASRLLSILDDQMVHKRKLGQAAVALGFMTQEQVNEVLATQKEQRRPLGMILVQRGLLTDAGLRKHLSDYFANQAPDSVGLSPSVQCSVSAHPQLAED